VEEKNMLSFEPKRDQRALCKAWEAFTQHGTIEEGIVPRHIADSWRRCKASGVNPYDFSPASYLETEEYAKRIRKQRNLIEIAAPIMESVYQSLEATRYLVVLYDSEGYHLLRIGQRADFQRSNKFKIREGLCFDEHHVGTSGFSLVKSLRKPVQITGCEHYSKLLHYVTGAYGPIFCPRKKALLGVFGVSGAKTIPNSHTLAIVIGSITAIEKLIELDHARRELTVFAKSLRIAVDSLEDGVVLIDKEMRICEINPVAQRALDIKREQVYGRPVSDIKEFCDIAVAAKASLKANSHKPKKTDCQIGNKIYLTTIKPLGNDQADVEGVMVQLRNVRHLTRAFQNLAGDAPRFTVENMVGSGQSITDVKNMIRTAARSDGCAIIEGESGTGKEVVAQAIHNASSRAKQPFVVVNCAAIPHELFESHLFGHERGSFTGASGTHIGKFELADRGTLFLDEIGEMPLSMQAKMLRALEERKIERVGGSKPFHVNVRILAAANRPLYDRVSKGLFRPDLFYRLNVFRIIVPPLRTRKEDILELAHFFLEEFAMSYEKPMPKLTKSYIDILLAHQWPGNVRELRNSIQYSVAKMDAESELLPSHLDGFLFLDDINTPVPRNSFGRGASSLSEIECDAILRTVRSHSGNKAKAARALGISRATIYRKLKKSSGSYH
jgi:transcriptional regulator with PAS, ATPase and Fis domain